MTVPVPPLTVPQLFTPIPSGVDPSGTQTAVAGDDTWLGRMLQVAALVQLPTTSWQSGAPERTIFAVEAVTFSESDSLISLAAQGSFLQTAASGSVTYQAPSGTITVIPVTPDPSNPAQNPTGTLGYLDQLAESVYDVDRLVQTAAAGPLAIVNLKSSTVGPYSALGYHASNTLTGATYSNTTTLTIPSSIIASNGGTVVGVVPGVTVTIISTQAPHGLSVNSVVYLAIPITSGLSGLSNVFATVTAVTSTTLSVAVGSSGAWTSGGQVYACTIAPMQADVAGIASNAGPGTVTTAITQNAGVFISNVVPWSGSNWESNSALAARCVLSLAAASPNGPSAAYQYIAQTAAQILAAQANPYRLTNGPVTANEFATPSTGVVSVVVASDTPASTALGANVTPGVAQLQITSISNANPAVLTCAGPTSLLAGQSMTVTISGALGIAGVNGTFTGTFTAPNALSIPVDTTTAGTYTGGGALEGGDLGQIDALIQARVVPDNTSAITISALALPIFIVAVVAVPQAFVATYRLAAPLQIAAQLNSYAIGGNAPSFSVAYNDIVGALEEAGVLTIGSVSYVRQVVSVSLNGQPAGAGVAFPTNEYKAVLASLTLSVQGV